jgi:hypothetical protein
LQKNAKTKCACHEMRTSATTSQFDPCLPTF